MAQPPAIRIEAFHLADFTHPVGSDLAGRSGLVMGYAIVHPDGVVLFDTGIGFGSDEIERAFRPVVRSLPGILPDRGIAPADVMAIANSHLHFDHCGQNVAFPGRPIHAQAVEYEATRGADYTIPEWVDFPGSRYVLHDGDAELLPGVRLIATPGHSPGHQSLLVEDGARRTAIAGQALWSRAEWNGSDDVADSGAASAWDPVAYRSSIERLRAFEPEVVLFGHDR
jgi:glyoxylase-like metal-dependent hydrolase (beta-lactamase superfamily II)